MLINAVAYARSLDIPPIGDGYVLLANPFALASLQRETGEKAWTDVVKYADPNALMTGVIGNFRGVTLVSSSRWLPAGGATKATCVLVGPTAWRLLILGLWEPRLSCPPRPSPTTSG